jgi:hypothetical protein
LVIVAIARLTATTRLTSVVKIVAMRCFMLNLSSRRLGLVVKRIALVMIRLGIFSDTPIRKGRGRRGFIPFHALTGTFRFGRSGSGGRSRLRAIVGSSTAPHRMHRQPQNVSHPPSPCTSTYSSRLIRPLQRMHVIFASSYLPRLMRLVDCPCRSRSAHG